MNALTPILPMLSGEVRRDDQLRRGRDQRVADGGAAPRSRGGWRRRRAAISGSRAARRSSPAAAHGPPRTRSDRPVRDNRARRDRLLEVGRGQAIPTTPGRRPRYAPGIGSTRVSTTMSAPACAKRSSMSKNETRCQPAVAPARTLCTSSRSPRIHTRARLSSLVEERILPPGQRGAGEHAIHGSARQRVLSNSIPAFLSPPQVSGNDSRLCLPATPRAPAHRAVR